MRKPIWWAIVSLPVMGIARPLPFVVGKGNVGPQDPQFASCYNDKLRYHIEKERD